MVAAILLDGLVHMADMTRTARVWMQSLLLLAVLLQPSYFVSTSGQYQKALCGCGYCCCH
jgi:hypothetical protein